MKATIAPGAREDILITPDSLRVAGNTLATITRECVSPTTSNTIHDGCAARWAAEQVITTPTDLFAPAPLGTAAHDVLENLYGLPQEERTKEAAMSLLMDLADRTIPDDPVRRHLWIAEVSSKYTPLFDMENPADIDILHREVGLDDVTLDGVPFSGFIDRVDSVDGRVRIIDYKTGKYSSPNDNYFDSYAQQIRLYALATAEKLDLDPRLGYLFYTAEGRKRQVAISKKPLATAKQIFVSSADKLFTYQDSGEYPMKVSPLCGWCPLVNICPAAAAAGKTARIAVPQADDLGFQIDTGHGTPCADDTADEAPVTSVDEAKGIPMTHNSKFIDDKPYVEDSYGKFNLGSYAAGATFSTVAAAHEALHQAGIAYDIDMIESLAVVMDDIFTQVQTRMIGYSTTQGGSHTRARHLFFSLARTELPIPFGADADAWAEWSENMVALILELASTSVCLYYGEVPAAEAAFAALAALGGADPDAADDTTDEPVANLMSAGFDPDLGY